MYKIEHIKDKNYEKLVLSNEDETNVVLLNLNEGGRLTLYKNQGITIVSDLENSPYRESFAAAILFPFANRIENGKYVFNDSRYQLPCNEKNINNAIHGLVFNKTFSVISKSVSDQESKVVLHYKETEEYDGFPFKYSIWLIYTLCDETVSLTVKVKNDGDCSYPFTLGWHPYFVSSDLQKTQLVLSAKEKFIRNDKGIVTNRKQFNDLLPIYLDKTKLDDAFTVDSNMAELITPDYRLKLYSSLAENYLQIYTPKNANAIAIEPMVGVSNSFNNKIGLQILGSNETFEKEWILKIFKN